MRLQVAADLPGKTVPSLRSKGDVSNLDWALVFICKDKDRNTPQDPVIPLDTRVSLDTCS